RACRRPGARRASGWCSSRGGRTEAARTRRRVSPVIGEQMVEEDQVARVGAASDDVACETEQGLDLDALQALARVLPGERDLDVRLRRQRDRLRNPFGGVVGGDLRLGGREPGEVAEE